MKVLVNFEESATVREAFKARGHDAWSCDLKQSRILGPHLQMDGFDAIYHTKWDMILMHPPCTALALSGNASYGKGTPKHQQRIESIEWTASLWTAACLVCEKVMLENPKNVLGPVIGKRTQIIQPWMFGHPEQKETWLWLHGLPALTSTKVVYGEMMALPKRERERLHYMSPGPNRARERSKTFDGIAKAMAEQWG